MKIVKGLSILLVLFKKNSLFGFVAPLCCIFNFCYLLLFYLISLSLLFYYLFFFLKILFFLFLSKAPRYIAVYF